MKNDTLVEEMFNAEMTTSEKDYVEQDLFISYILDEVNPARKNAGLSTIEETEAAVCYRIIKDFEENWKKD